MKSVFETQSMDRETIISKIREAKSALKKEKERSLKMKEMLGKRKGEREVNESFMEKRINRTKGAKSQQNIGRVKKYVREDPKAFNETTPSIFSAS